MPPVLSSLLMLCRGSSKQQLQAAAAPAHPSSRGGSGGRGVEAAGSAAAAAAARSGKQQHLTRAAAAPSSMAASDRPAAGSLRRRCSSRSGRCMRCASTRWPNRALPQPARMQPAKWPTLATRVVASGVPKSEVCGDSGEESMVLGSGSDGSSSGSGVVRTGGKPAVEGDRAVETQGKCGVLHGALATKGVETQGKCSETTRQRRCRTAVEGDDERPAGLVRRHVRPLVESVEHAGDHLPTRGTRQRRGQRLQSRCCRSAAPTISCPSTGAPAAALRLSR